MYEKQLQNALRKMGFFFGEHGLMELLETSDFDKNDQVDFKEFVVALAISCFLNSNDPEESQDLHTQTRTELVSALMLAVDAFTIFDSDNDGFISVKEVKL